MSRIGKKPVALVKGVSASISGQTIEVKGPKGTRSFTAGDDVTLTIEADAVKVTPRGTSKRARQQWGMSRSMIQNLVTGVTTGFRKEMEIQGVGYRAAVTGNVLKLSLGYSHEVNFEAPAGVTVTSPKQPKSLWKASTSSKLAKWPQTSASGRSPSPTRARVSATRASMSSARKARRSKGRNHGEQQERAVPQAPPARPEQTQGNVPRAFASFGAPLVQEHLASN